MTFVFSWLVKKINKLLTTQGYLRNEIITPWNRYLSLNTHFMLKCFTFTFCLDVLRASNILGSLDNKYLVKLRSYLIPVLQSSSRSRFVKCWRAKTDGWEASAFHSRCDGKGPTVTIIKVGSYIFGGYTDVSWSSSKYQFMVAPFSLSLLFCSGVNVERSDLRIRCSPRKCAPTS